MYQPVYQPPHKPLGEYVKMLLSDVILAVLLFVGLLFLWLGSLLYGLADPGDKEVGNGFWSFGMLLATMGWIAIRPTRRG